MSTSGIPAVATSSSVHTLVAIMADVMSPGSRATASLPTDCPLRLTGFHCCHVQAPLSLLALPMQLIVHSWLRQHERDMAPLPWSFKPSGNGLDQFGEVAGVHEHAQRQRVAPRYGGMIAASVPPPSFPISAGGAAPSALASSGPRCMPRMTRARALPAMAA